MVKKPATPKRKPAASRVPTRQKVRLFQPISWYDRTDNPVRYLIEIYSEMARLGIMDSDLHRHHREVLENMHSWLRDHPGEQYAALVNWKNLNLDVLAERHQDNVDDKPRIELAAEVTKKQNLSVKWYPRGWHDAKLDFTKEWRSEVNLMERYRFPVDPDFVWFEGDEPATYQGRASNELMFIRGVGHLDPQPRDEYGFYATYNSDVMNANLISMVAAAYNRLIGQLNCSFSVTVIDHIQIETREEVDKDDEFGASFPKQRPIHWKIVTTSPPSLKPSADIVEMPMKRR